MNTTPARLCFACRLELDPDESILCKRCECLGRIHAELAGRRRAGRFVEMSQPPDDEDLQGLMREHPAFKHLEHNKHHEKRHC